VCWGDGSTCRTTCDWYDAGCGPNGWEIICDTCGHCWEDYAWYCWS
jgi:hypothetical protein